MSTVSRTAAEPHSVEQFLARIAKQASELRAERAELRLSKLLHIVLYVNGIEAGDTVAAKTWLLDFFGDDQEEVRYQLLLLRRWPIAKPHLDDLVARLRSGVVDAAASESSFVDVDVPAVPAVPTVVAVPAVPAVQMQVQTPAAAVPTPAATSWLPGFASFLWRGT